MKLVLRSVLCVCLGLLLLPGCGDDDEGPMRATTLTEIGTVDLDMAVDGGEGYPEVEGPMLEAGRDYVVRVEGTYSIWGASMWSGGACRGTPGDAPQIPSPSGANAQVGVDAEFWFAIPQGSSLCNNFPIPNHTGRIEFSLDGGATFDHVETSSGEPTAPSIDHTYEYAIEGLGQALRIRREDGSTGDDYGVLRFTVLRVD